MNRNQSLLQKMILISPELLTKWKQMLIDDEQLTQTDLKLKKIIMDGTMNDADKWYHYQQVLLQSPHKFRYWNADNKKSTGTQSESSERYENIRHSIGTQIDNVVSVETPETGPTVIKTQNISPIETKPSKFYRNEEFLPPTVIERKFRNPTETEPSKLKQNSELSSKSTVIQNDKLEENNPIVTEKAKNNLEKAANAVITESILRKKALLQMERGGILKLQRLRKTKDNKVIGARYYDDVNNHSISVDLSSEDEMQAEIESDYRPTRVRKQQGKGKKSRKNIIKTGKMKIPWTLYK